MLRSLAALAALAALLAVPVPGLAHEPFMVQFQWDYVNYTWPSEEAYLKAEKDESYVEKNNIISGIKFWRERMYLTVPRYRGGVPVTLASTPMRPVNGETAPRLEPFPSWEMQRLGDCAAFQHVQSMEVDPRGRMWVLDTGRTALLDIQPSNACPPRLVILDLEQAGAVLRSYAFPAEVARPEGAILNDIVLDHEDGGLAYISDSDKESPGIIVFSLENSTSWKVRDDSMNASRDADWITIEKVRVRPEIHVDGVALSPAGGAPGARILYYSPLSSFSIFQVSTRALKAAREPGHSIRSEVSVLGRKPSQSDGMVMSNTGVLYFGLLGDDAVSLWDSRANPSFVTGQRIISRDHHLMQWPDSFAFDGAGGLWCVTNRLHAFFDGSLTTSRPNFRAIRASVPGLTSYQYLENGAAPPLPDIAAGAPGLAAASARDLILAAGLAGLLLLLG